MNHPPNKYLAVSLLFIFWNRFVYSSFDGILCHIGQWMMLDASLSAARLRFTQERLTTFPASLFWCEVYRCVLSDLIVIGRMRGRFCEEALILCVSGRMEWGWK